MALFLDKSTDFGVVATYHRIESVSFSKKDQSVIILICSYLNQDVAATKKPVSMLPIKLESNYSITSEQAYQHLKTLPEFEGAEDC